MNICRWSGAVALGWICAIGLAWADGPWEVVHQGTKRGEVTSYVKEVDGHDVKAFKGVVEAPVPMSALLAVLTTVDSLPDWVFQCVRARHDAGWPEPVHYLEFHAPWPVSNREVVVRNNYSQDPQTYVVSVNTTAITGYMPPSDGKVRVPELNNRFVFEPLKDGWTRVTFETLVDPGGSLPAWVSNWVATSAPRVTLNGMMKLAAQPRFRNKPVEEIKLPGLKSWRMP
ncbi:MAG TPA: START domain-containing protein [Moraxellaceae bacterium]|nr:START domain-containing protein [Moraxellaceae bacterium]